MKLSEQYEHHIQKLNEVSGDVYKAPVKPKYDAGNVLHGTAPAGDVHDPLTWIQYSLIGVSVLSMIFGRPAMLKLFGRKVTGPNGGVTRYNVFKRIKDKKAMKAVGFSDAEMRDVWMKFQRQLQLEDEKFIDKMIKNVVDGNLSAKDAMVALGRVIPRGAKASNYSTLLAYEKIAAAKAAKKTAKKAAKTQSVVKPTTTTSTVPPLTSPLNPATTAVRGAVSNGVNYPNITQKQFDNLSILDRVALEKQPNLTYNQLTTGNY